MEYSVNMKYHALWKKEFILEWKFVSKEWNQLL